MLVVLYFWQGVQRASYDGIAQEAKLCFGRAKKKQEPSWLSHGT
jgi:hypothetical protein